ncbi:MAG: hypothetical protein ACE5FF_02035 [Saprospiraceae bacterium]
MKNEIQFSPPQLLLHIPGILVAVLLFGSEALFWRSMTSLARATMAGSEKGY